IPQGFSAVRYHSLMARSPLPPGLRVTAWTSDEIPMALEHLERPIWGVQFHPESISTEHGAKLLENFRRLAKLDQRSVPILNSDAVISYPETTETSTWSVFSRKLTDCPSTEATFCSLYGESTSAFWLDSAGTSAGRFSFMGAADGPHGLWLSYSTEGQQLEIHSNGKTELRQTSLFDYLQTELRQRRCSSAELPFDFNCGFVGYFGYELKAECGGRAAHRSQHPDACLIFADRMIAFDHQENAVYLVAAGPSDQRQAADAWFDEMQQRMESRLPLPQPAAPATPPDVDIVFHPNQTHAQYLDSIQKCLEFIRAGESYEICLTNQMSAATAVPPLDYYRGLRRSNPAPQSAFLQFPQVSVACSSPERFLKIDTRGHVESRPIKGTLKRSANETEDRKLRETLRTNVKTRSENLMIVDLLRNDLGRVCEIGSVHVPQMMEVETYTNLHQLVSTVRGQLRRDASAIDCLRSTFPGGSMTGAPKIRTMELIDQLETSARGIYSGAIGFLGLNGSADLNIVIRTAVFSGGKVSIGVGGAVVALSDPESEFEECILKGRALVDAFRPFMSGKTS
ncbi:MAG: aminodeoxychorismate synthase component I, partial [Luteolibacter sp.]